MADRFLAEGKVVQAAMIGPTVLDMSDFPTRHPYTLGIWQNQIERIMAAWIAELPVRAHYGRQVSGFTQDGGASTSSCPTARRCGRNTSSGATADAASSVKQRGSSSQGGTRPGEPDRGGRGDRGTSAGHSP